MNNTKRPVLASLGFLRQALLGATLINTAMPVLYLLFDSDAGRSLWNIVATMIAPSLSLLFAVVILFDYIMSRVRAADTDGAERAHFIAIGRIELAVLAVTLAFWIPYFVYLLT